MPRAAAIAPYTDQFDWFAGMNSPGALHAAREGREARERFAETEEFDPEQFLPADWAALEERWSSLGADVGRSEAYGPGGLIDDDVAFASPWGFELEAIRPPVLLVQGEHSKRFGCLITDIWGSRESGGPPDRSVDPNAYGERFTRSIKAQRLKAMNFVGQRALCRAPSEAGA